MKVSVCALICIVRKGVWSFCHFRCNFGCTFSSTELGPALPEASFSWRHVQCANTSGARCSSTPAPSLYAICPIRTRAAVRPPNSQGRQSERKSEKGLGGNERQRRRRTRSGECLPLIMDPKGLREVSSRRRAGNATGTKEDYFCRIPSREILPTCIFNRSH